MASIRITGVPAGEAPEEVREAWVGLTLPLLDGKRGERRVYNGAGVLSGPKSYLGMLVQALRRDGETWDGYAVDARTAVAVLAIKDARAAQWWEQNTPHLMKAGRALVFTATVCSVCVEEPPPEGMKSPLASPTGE